MTTGTLRVVRTPRWYTGRSELIVVAGVILLASLLTWGTLAMEVPDGTAFPGPQFFPTIVVVFLYGVGIALAIDVLRRPQRAHVADDPTEISNEMLEDFGAIDATSEIRVVSPEDVVPVGQVPASRVDWRTLLIVVGGLAGFILVLPIAGWLLSAAALFWIIAFAFGSRRPLMDIAIAVITSSVVQLAFGAGLGLPLPAGILEGVAPWIS
ncbi:tripartite tricarboxylate transporter TctB family protein [Microbacterium sp. SLBN-146]|uniref:tripartite tricarboxylate transporter TctB family protein n=1 Tax=Microbacterium sp. SLBN-146 TaxID=2768457 RepID=UPI0011500495|nr:tripartite tricarboxylate transporter TctB family protein [Microbacterium sp. SLBN-146]TQJ31298.1 putative tricarboxylic transport membrane protein [Microbacterium sp. SLBN-146]